MRESQSGTALQADRDGGSSLSEGILSFVEYAPRLLIVLPSRQFWTCITWVILLRHRRTKGVTKRDVLWCYRASRLSGVVNRHLSFVYRANGWREMGSRNVTPSIRIPNPNHPDVLSEWFTQIFGIITGLKGVAKRAPLWCYWESR